MTIQDRRCAKTRVGSAVLLAGLFGLLSSAGLMAQPYGLTNRPQIGAFLNGQLPPATQTPDGWQVVAAFPNVSFDDPVCLLAEPNANRLYVCERQGRVYFFENNPGTTTKTLFVDLSAVTQGYDDCGLIGMAFHPEYGNTNSPNRGYVYIYYQFSENPTSGPGRPPSATPGFNRLSRFTVQDGSSVADPASELILINQYDRHVWHNGGGMFFGPEGFLYLSNGDEGAARDNYEQSQEIDSGLFSGVLRIDVDMDPARSHPIRRQPQNDQPPPSGWTNVTFSANYFIPDDNPWQDTNGTILEEFYAIGLRSPHRMTYDPPTDRIWLGDVGQGNREEIDIIVRAGNYQWAYREGSANGFDPMPNPLIGIDTPPIYDYGRSAGDTCVIGGYVYRGLEFADTLHGKYIFGDNTSGRIWAMTYDGTNAPTVVELLDTGWPNNYQGLSSFGIDNNNELYICKMGRPSKIYKLARSGAQPPTPPALLSQTGAFNDLTTLTPAPELIPYGVNSPLWSDAAAKGRWTAIPNDGLPYGPEEVVGFAATGEWDFPVGTVFIKHFELGTNETNATEVKRLETRFFVHATNNTWYGLTYRWRADHTDADLLPGGLDEEILVQTASTVRTQTWQYPSRQDCLTCHNETANRVLGVKTRQLNGDLLYPSTGVTDNQLRTWNHLGLFDTVLAETNIVNYDKLVEVTNQTASLEFRVRSYLDSNCAHCHRPDGVAALFDARSDTPLEQQGLVNGAVVDALGVPGARIVLPQNPGQSLLYVRDNTLGAEQMPPLARNVIDTNYINTLAAWINSLPPPPVILGTIGNAETSPSADNLWSDGDYINAARFQAPSNMVVALMYANVAGISGNYQCAVYSDSGAQPGTLLETTTSVTDPVTGWHTFPLNSPLALSGGAFYWLAIWSDSSNAAAYYSDNGGTLRWGQYDFGAWPDPVVTTGGGTFNYSIYATGGSAPTFTDPPSDRFVSELSPMVVTNSATDADVPFQSLSYQLVNSPTGSTIDSHGVITWTPSEQQGPSTNTFTTTVTDGVVTISNSFVVTVLEVNVAPTAVADSLPRFITQGIETPDSTLLTNDFDADGDTVILTGVISPTLMGATVSSSNALIYYQPLFGDTNADTFSYVVGDGKGGVATGQVTVTVQSEPPATEVLGIQTGVGEFTLTFTGVPGFTYTVQYTDTFDPANWQNLGVVTADGLGQVQIVDDTPGSGPARFYRAVRGSVP